MYSAIDQEKTGKNLKEIVQKKGLSVKEIQKYLGMSCAQSIYHWFSGCTLPSVDNLYALSHLLQVPIDSILKESEDDEEVLEKTGTEMK